MRISAAAQSASEGSEGVVLIVARVVLDGSSEVGRVWTERVEESSWTTKRRLSVRLRSVRIYWVSWS